MLIAPSDKSKPKIHERKEWWWCDAHKKYGRHKPADCKGSGYVHVPGGTKSDPRKLKIAKALEAVTEEAGSESEDEDTSDSE